jgi:hypothetical protein
VRGSDYAALKQVGTGPDRNGTVGVREVLLDQSAPAFRLHQMANLDALSAKRQRTLPAACRVYDLLNFASEVATLHATEMGNRLVQAFIGDLISGEYDLA